MRHVAVWINIAIAGAFLASTGCTKTVEETLSNVKKDIQTTVTQPAAPPKPSGTIEIQLDQPVKTIGCSVKFVTFNGARPSVLKVTSYDDPAKEAFPSVLLQAQVTGDSASQLSGQIIKAEAYVMTAEDAPTWHSPPLQDIDVKLTVNGNQVEGEIVGGSMINPLTGTNVSVTGKFSGNIL